MLREYGEHTFRHCIAADVVRLGTIRMSSCCCCCCCCWQHVRRQWPPVAGRAYCTWSRSPSRSWVPAPTSSRSICTDSVLRMESNGKDLVTFYSDSHTCGYTVTKCTTFMHDAHSLSRARLYMTQRVNVIVV